MCHAVSQDKELIFTGNKTQRKFRNFRDLGKDFEPRPGSQTKSALQFCDLQHHSACPALQNAASLQSAQKPYKIVLFMS